MFGGVENYIPVVVFSHISFLFFSVSEKEKQIKSVKCCLDVIKLPTTHQLQFIIMYEHTKQTHINTQTVSKVRKTKQIPTCTPTDS